MAKKGNIGSTLRLQRYAPTQIKLKYPSPQYKWNLECVHVVRVIEPLQKEARGYQFWSLFSSF